MTDGIQIGSKDLLLMGGSDEFSAGTHAVL